MALYMLGLALAFIEPLLAFCAHTLVAILWFLPVIAGKPYRATSRHD
jgi:hypothetical protein